MKFGINTSPFENLFQSESVVSDTYMDYQFNGLGTMKLKVFDTKYLIQGVEFFRPFIRGFLVLMMFLYHVRQVISFFGYDAGVVAGRTEHILEAKKAQRG